MTGSPEEAQDFTAWIGRREMRAEVLSPGRSHALLAALGQASEEPAGVLPPLHHWLYFWDVRPSAELGEDGHPRRGGFLPPIPLPRRMWAGGRLTFHQPLHLGEAVRRVSTIRSIQPKSGRSGRLIFVTLAHEISGDHGLAVSEEQDLVYRDPPSPGAAPAAPEPASVPAQWRETLTPDPVLLFRYSALTMNGHRIHYDQPYATGVEGYDGLVVHGPLQATLLIALARRGLEATIARFDYRGLSPATAAAPLNVCGRPTPGGAELWVEQAGRRTFSARAALSADPRPTPPSRRPRS